MKAHWVSTERKRTKKKGKQNSGDYWCYLTHFVLHLFNVGTTNLGHLFDHILWSIFQLTVIHLWIITHGQSRRIYNDMITVVILVILVWYWSCSEYWKKHYNYSGRDQSIGFNNFPIISEFEDHQTFKLRFWTLGWWFFGGAVFCPRSRALEPLLYVLGVTFTKLTALFLYCSRCRLMWSLLMLSFA